MANDRDISTHEKYDSSCWAFYSGSSAGWSFGSYEGSHSFNAPPFMGGMTEAVLSKMQASTVPPAGICMENQIHGQPRSRIEICDKKSCNIIKLDENKTCIFVSKFGTTIQSYSKLVFNWQRYPDDFCGFGLDWCLACFGD